MSIIMRSYNRPDKLPSAITSILSQSYTNWELIIVDDASSDPGVDQVLNACQDSRIKIVRNKVNRDGHCILINQAIDEATGEYIAFCDDDDMREPEWLEAMGQCLVDHDFAICKSKDIKGAGVKIVRGYIPVDVTQLYNKNLIDLGELVLRRGVLDQVGMFDERVHYGDDWEFVSRLVKAGLQGGVVDQPLCIHMLHRGGQLFTRSLLQRNATKMIIESKKVHSVCPVAVFWPDPSRLQVSQHQVVDGVRDALHQMPHVNVVADGQPFSTTLPAQEVEFIFVVVPFQCAPQELSALRAYNVPMVAILTEDPAAINSNLANSVYFDWVITNDKSTLPKYQERGKAADVPYTPDRVGFMPCLSVNTSIVSDSPRKPVPKWDMVICGYAYDSRLVFFRKIADKIDWKLLLVGRRWDEFGDKFEVLGDQPLGKTMEIYSDTQIIACIHRQPSDLGGTIAFKSAARGYVEAYSGALVMIDNTRQICPPFEPDEVLIYDYQSPEDFLEKAHWAVSHPEDTAAMGRKAQERAQRDFSYTARMSRLLRDLRGPRAHIRVP